MKRLRRDESSAPERRRSLVVGLAACPAIDADAQLALLAALRGAERSGASIRFFGPQTVRELPQLPMDVATAIRQATGFLVAAQAWDGTAPTAARSLFAVLGAMGLQNRPVGLLVRGSPWQKPGAAKAELARAAVAAGGLPVPTSLVMGPGTHFTACSVCTDPDLGRDLERLGRSVAAWSAEAVAAPD